MFLLVSRLSVCFFFSNVDSRSEKAFNNRLFVAQTSWLWMAVTKQGAGKIMINFEPICGSVISILIRKNVQKSIILGSNKLAWIAVTRQAAVFESIILRIGNVDSHSEKRSEICYLWLQ